MRVAVTGAGGRLGRALVEALQDAPFSGPLGPLAWSRPSYDIDDPGAAARCVRQMAPEVTLLGPEPPLGAAPPLYAR